MNMTPTPTALTDSTVATIQYQTQAAITKRVEIERQNRGMSIRRLADELAMNYSNLSHRLQGRVEWTITDVVAFRRRFGVDLMDGL